MDEKQPDMPLLDRPLQLELLNRLAASYPDAQDVQTWGPDPAAVTRNLAYLDEHGLADVRISEWMGAPNRALIAKITARGLDFLADDGGLGAILGVVQVRLEAESVRELIAARIDAADLPADQKGWLRKHLADLPGEALKTVTKRLVEEALARSPDAIQLLQRWLGS